MKTRSPVLSLLIAFSAVAKISLSAVEDFKPSSTTSSISGVWKSEFDSQIGHQVYTFTFKQDGFYHVGCDIHPAMSAEIISTSTPFATAAADDGSYEFDDVPPGAYQLTVYSGGKKTQSDVEVKGPPPRGTPSPE